MKRLLLLAACCLWTLRTQAQNEAYTTWPYYYSEFRQGNLVLSNGQERILPVNIHLLKGELHFIDDRGLIQMAPAGQFSSVTIGEEQYRRVEGILMAVTPGPDERHFVAVRHTADLQSVNETGGAYGVSSATSSTRRITSVDMPGLLKTSHMELLQNRETGKKLSIKSEYFIVIDGKAVKANRRAVSEAIGRERATEFKQFLKNNKINWKKEESLLKVVEFLDK